MCIPYKNKSSYPLIYPVTVYPALLLIEKYSIVVDKDRPITIPKFLANEFMLPQRYLNVFVQQKTLL